MPRISKLSGKTALFILEAILYGAMLYSIIAFQTQEHIRVIYGGF